MTDAVLSARYILEYTYTRSVGPIMGQFFEALRARRIEGARTRSGRVIVPPTEYDPATGEPCEGLTQVSASGVVATWAWISEPRPMNPLAHPFAWALIKLDGADTALLHAVDAGEITRMRTGMRVRARWASEPKGGIQDIACFVPEDT